MAQEDSARSEVIFGGLGGGGVLLAGEMLARAATSEYEHVVWFPHYAATVRGGPSQCTVICSHQPIASPVLSKAQAVVILDSSQLKTFEDHARPGGKIIVENTGLVEEVARQDVEVIKIPALELAIAMGNRLGANFIVLGAYVGATHAVSSKSVERQLEDKFGAKPKVLSANLEAFRKGLTLADTRGS